MKHSFCISEGWCPFLTNWGEEENAIYSGEIQGRRKLLNLNLTNAPTYSNTYVNILYIFILFPLLP